jgi:hypothetical protein
VNNAAVNTAVKLCSVQFLERKTRKVRLEAKWEEIEVYYFLCTSRYSSDP